MLSHFLIRIVQGPRSKAPGHCTAPRRKLVGEKGNRDLNLLVLEADAGMEGGGEEVEEDEEGEVFVLVGGMDERAVTEWEEEEEEREATSSSPSSMAEWLYNSFLLLFRLVIATLVVDGEGRGEWGGLCEVWGGTLVSLPRGQ